VKAINRVLQGIEAPGGPSFRHAAAVKGKPSGYLFLPKLADTTVSQISIEAAAAWTGVLKAQEEDRHAPG
jgi:hypothetical protein